MGIFEDMTEQRVSVQVGQPAVLNLPPIDSVPALSVQWQTEEGELNYDIKYAETSDNQLIILNTEIDDKKAYRARALNPQLGKEENSAFIHLNVLPSDHLDASTEIMPEIIVHPKSMKLVRGQKVAALQCIANARPLYQLETLWMKDGLLIDNSGVQYTLNDPWNRTLTLLNANLTHTGQYSCEVRLKSGNYESVVSMASISVQEPPAFFTPMRSETLGDYGSKMTLPCDVVGDPAPYVTWFRNSEALNLAGGRYSVREDNSLVIRKLTMQDAAMFQCLASNEAGEATSYTWLKVKSEYRGWVGCKGLVTCRINFCN